MIKKMDDFDIFSADVRKKAIYNILFYFVMYVSIWFFDIQRVQLLIIFTVIIVLRLIFNETTPINFKSLIVKILKSLAYLYIFIAVLTYLGKKLLIYGIAGYLTFILIYVAFILYRRRKMFISGIDQIISGLKKVKKVETREVKKER